MAADIKPRAPAATAAVVPPPKPRQIIEIDQPIFRSGKEGKIIWIGAESHEKNVKIRWSDGSIEFFATKELQ